MKRRVFINVLPPALVISGGAPLSTLVNTANAEPADTPRRVGLEDLEHLRVMISEASQLSMRWGGGMVRDLLGVQMRWAVSLLDAHIDPAIADDLYSEVGSLAGFTGWACHDVGANTAAQRYIEVALRCAGKAGDWELYADSYSNLSRMLVHGGDGDTALTMSQQSQIRTDRLSPLARGCMAAVEAGAHGMRGDGQSCLAAVRRAEEHLASAVPANETTVMLDFFSPAQLASDSGYALLPLAMRGEHVATTVELLRSAVELYPTAKARPRVLAGLRLSALLFAQGDPAEAVAVATNALDGAGSVRSQRIVTLLTELQRLTTHPRYRSMAGIPVLHQRITDTLAA